MTIWSKDHENPNLAMVNTTATSTNATDCMQEQRIPRKSLVLKLMLF